MAWKIPPRRVDSSDCVVYVGRVVKDGKITEPGTPYRIHEGEWVEVLPILTMRDYLTVGGLLNMDSTASPTDLMARLGKVLDDVCQQLSRRLTAWNWTDMDRSALPQPHANPEVLKSLADDELAWLLLAARGETPGERKNALPPSVSTSSGAVPSLTMQP